MQYHTLSLLQAGHTVTAIGYTGEALIDELQQQSTKKLRVIRFSVPQTPKLIEKVKIIYLIWRIILLTIYFCHALFVSVPASRRNVDSSNRTTTTAPKVDCLLLQNPPALPTLAVAALYAKIYKTGLVIDWHNLGYSMFGSLKLQKVVKYYEKMLAQHAHQHLCVTHAMKSYLEQDFQLSPHTIRTFYDCPPSLFQPLSITEQHGILSKLHDELNQAVPKSWLDSIGDPSQQTLFTERTANGTIQPRLGRPALITSSTSWTPDEDFGPLLEACRLLNDRINHTRQCNLKVMVVVTGKGPQKEYYQEQISKLRLEHVCITTVWLEPGDYPKLIGCADVGISLHTSTSSLDLPMKILDLFGCQVPVLARKFACLNELVQETENGRTFDTADQLADQLWELLQPLGDTTSRTLLPAHGFGTLKTYSQNLQNRPRWSETWTSHALPAIEAAAAKAVADDKKNQ